MSDQDEFLTGGTLGIFTKATLGGRESQVGDHIRLVITEEPKKQQQRDYLDSTKLKFYSDGNPMMQLVVLGQVDGAFEPVDDHDDGRRAAYIKGGTKQDVMAGLRAAGAKRLDVGGVLDITIDRIIPSNDPKFKDAKRWKVVYEKPSQFEQAVNSGDLRTFNGANPLGEGNVSARQSVEPAGDALTADELVKLATSFPEHVASLKSQPSKARAILATL